MALGTLAKSSNTDSWAAGFGAQARGTNSTALGSRSLATSTDAFAVGVQSRALASNATSFGTGANASGVDSQALGYLPMLVQLEALRLALTPMSKVLIPWQQAKMPELLATRI
jgi:hypothetical protein